MGRSRLITMNIWCWSLLGSKKRLSILVKGILQSKVLLCSCRKLGWIQMFSQPQEVRYCSFWKVHLQASRILDILACTQQRPQPGPHHPLGWETHRSAPPWERLASTFWWNSGVSSFLPVVSWDMLLKGISKSSWLPMSKENSSPPNFTVPQF